MIHTDTHLYLEGLYVVTVHMRVAHSVHKVPGLEVAAVRNLHFAATCVSVCQCVRQEEDGDMNVGQT